MVLRATPFGWISLQIWGHWLDPKITNNNEPTAVRPVSTTQNGRKRAVVGRKRPQKKNEMHRVPDVRCILLICVLLPDRRKPCPHKCCFDCF